MHIDAICAAIDLRNPQKHKINEFFWKAAVLQIDVHASESLVACGRHLGVFDTMAHDESSYSLVAGFHRAASWPTPEGS
jgi:hypothetical protein